MAPIDLELDGPGENVDDPCFWVDPIDPSGSLIRNMYEIREALEAMGIRLACQRITDEQIERAQEYHNRANKAIRNRDVEQLIKMNSAFHNELLAACGNEQLLSMVQLVRNELFDRRTVRLFVGAESRAMMRHHEQILEAVRQRKASLAEKAVRRHVRSMLRILTERL